MSQRGIFLNWRYVENKIKLRTDQWKEDRWKCEEKDQWERDKSGQRGRENWKRKKQERKKLWLYQMSEHFESVRLKMIARKAEN